MKLRRKAGLSGTGALIILLAIVAAFGLLYTVAQQQPSFGGVSDLKTITITAATLYGGKSASGSGLATSNFTFSLNNPGSETTITMITLSGGRLDTPITEWSTSNTMAGLVIFEQPHSPGNSNALTGGQVTSFTFYPVSNASQVIAQNVTYSYVINFESGQSVSGILTAQ